MIEEKVQEEAAAFRSLWAGRLGDFPALVPDSTWPSFWAADALCYFLRYREDWSQEESAFLRGTAAHLAEFIHASWSTFSRDVTVQSGKSGIECVVKAKVGLFRSEKYILPLERVMTSILQKPQSPFPVLGAQYIMASDATNLLGSFGLGACFAMSPHGEGPWGNKMPGDLMHHLDQATPLMAKSTGDYYRRVHPDGGGAPAQDAFYMNQLIWPPGGYHGDYCGSVAAGGIRKFEKESKTELRTEDLLNLVKMPDPTISHGAAVHIIKRLGEEFFPREISEIFFQSLGNDAGGYRQVALELAKERGVTLDWMRTRDIHRFTLEKQMNLLGLLVLEFDQCLSGGYADLVMALIQLDVKRAMEELDRIKSPSPHLLFQRAAILKAMGQHAEAYALHEEVLRKEPSFSNSEFFDNQGMICLHLDRVDEAIMHLTRAVEIDPANGRAWSNLGWAYLKAQHLEYALQVLNQAVEFANPVITILLNRAIAYRQLGKQDEAWQDILQAAHLWPFDRRCVANLMAPYFLQGQA